MKAVTALVLVVLGTASIAAGLQLRPHNEATPAGSGQPVFPGIANVLTKATKVRITGSGKSSTLEQKNGVWTLAERGSYPVQPSKLRTLFAGLVELRLIEPRTADPDSFARLGVDDPAKPGSTAVLMQVDSDAGAPLAELISGHRSQRSQGGLPETVYVRRPAEQRAWLAEGRLPADSDPQAWLIREVIDIPASRIAAVVVDHGGQKLSFVRNGESMVLAEPPPGKLDSYRVDEVGRALEGVTLADVRRGPLPGAAIGKSVFKTTDGLVIEISVAREDKHLWARFTASGKGAETYAGLTGWAYELPEWRQTALAPANADLIEAEPVK
jgi:hypothetical protein